MSSVYWQQVPNELNSLSRLLIIGLTIIQGFLPNASVPGDNLYQGPLLPDPHQATPDYSLSPTGPCLQVLSSSGFAEPPAISPYTSIAAFV